MFGYDLDGQPIDADEAGELLQDVEARRIGLDEIPLVGGSVAVVSTVFLVIDHGLGPPDPPLLWETMVFFDATLAEEYCERYTTRESRRAGPP